MTVGLPDQVSSFLLPNYCSDPIRNSSDPIILFRGRVVKTTKQSSKTSQKRLTKLNNICALSLLAGSIISIMPATALGNNHLSAPDLFDDYGVQQATGKTLPAKAVNGKNHTVNVHTDLLWSDSLTLNLFDDVVVTAVRDRLIDKVKGNTTWIGHVEGVPESEVFLTVRGKTMSGTVKMGNDLYEIETHGNNTHNITKVDPDLSPEHRNPDHHDAKPVENSAEGDATTAPLAAGDFTGGALTTAGTIIDVMVVYTPKALLNSGGQAGIETKIANAVAQANQAYLNSQVDMQINVVHTEQISYVETGDMTVSLNALTSTSDGKMDNVHTLRNQYGADQVVLLSADTNYCGYAWIMGAPSSSFAPNAFAVVHDSSTYACLSNYTLAHELGHNLGNQHDRTNAPFQGSYSYSYGYRLCETGGYGSIMSYSCTGASRVGYFSNPNVTLSTGQVTGTSTENNALSMNKTKDTVAAFRSIPGSTPPIAPSNLTANTLSPSEITVTWSDMSNDETGFRLERSMDGVNWIEIAVTAGNIASFVDNGLAASTNYKYRVRAYNSKGSSSYSNIGNATTQAGCTANTPVLSIAPSTLYSKPGATVTYNITLTNKDTAACSASTFTLTNSDGATLGSYSLNAGSSTTATWSKTAPATDGSTINSVTASATSHANVNQSATVIVDGTAPSAPVSLKATVKKNSLSATLSWLASTDSGSGVDHYDIKRNGTKIGTTTSTSYTNKSGKGTFTFTVEAYDKAGNLKGSSITTTVI